MTTRDYIEFLIGRRETTLIGFAILLAGISLVYVQFTQQVARYAIGTFILLITLIILILGYSALPKRQLERAQVHFQQFENTDTSSVKKDKLHSQSINYSIREQKARQLELEVAELRYYGPKEFYGTEPWIYILFISTILLMFAYGICWIVYEYNNSDSISYLIRVKRKIYSSHKILPKIQIRISATRSTPEVILNKEGSIKFRGRLIPNDALNFFRPIDVWISEYQNNPAETTYVDINLDVINADSKKFLIQTIQNISHVTLKNKNFIINWYHDGSDSEILEIGEQLASVLDIPFSFIRNAY
jgi:hypothetical protein